MDAQRAVVVLEHAPLPTWMRWLPLLQLVVMAVFVYAALRPLMKGARLTCDRASATCTIRTSTLVTHDLTVVALAEIRDVRVDPVPTSKGTSWSLAFETERGLVPISARADGNLGRRREQASRIESFLTDATAPSLDLTIDAIETPLFFGLGVVVLVFVVQTFAFSRTSRVEIDRLARTVTVRRSRWPLPPATCTVPLAQVKGAALETISLLFFRRFRPALRLVSGEHVLVWRQWLGFERHQRAFVDRLTHALERARDHRS